MKMNKMIQRTAISGMLAALAVALPTTMASAMPTSNVNVSAVTDASAERSSFIEHMQKARQEITGGNYDAATLDANQARHWFLAFADSVALEKPSYTWDTVRDMESDLTTAYLDLGRLYHIAGKYSQAVNVLASSLSVNPYQPEARYQEMLAYVAMHDANDNDFDANDIDMIEQNIDRINQLDDVDNNGVPDAMEDLNGNGIVDAQEIDHYLQQTRENLRQTGEEIKQDFNRTGQEIENNLEKTQDQINEELNPGY